MRRYARSAGQGMCAGGGMQRCEGMRIVREGTCVQGGGV